METEEDRIGQLAVFDISANHEETFDLEKRSDEDEEKLLITENINSIAQVEDNLE